MTDIESSLTVFFEEPFWVGVYERTSENRLEVCRVVFGAEPKDYEVYAFFLKNWARLQFSPPVEREGRGQRAVSPKRLQREIRHSLMQTGVGTKAQQALARQHEQNKQERSADTRLMAQQEAQRRFACRQLKKKEKHRGR